jgi:signal transduction histidine kinase
VELTQARWYYRWGDSPLDDHEMPVWIYEDTIGTEWKPVENSPDFQKNPQKHHNLWLLIQLPEGYWKSPSILIPPVYQSLEVYQNHQRIYQFGEFRPSDSNKFSSSEWHNIPLEDVRTGSAPLHLRIYSHRPQQIGIANYEKVWLGSQMDLIGVLIKLGTEQFILSFIFIFAGLFSVFVYFRRKKEKSYAALSSRDFLSCGAFVTFMGISQLGASSTSQLFIRSPAARYYMGIGAIYMCPIAFHIFFEQIIGSGYKKLVRRIWQFSIPFALISLILDIARVFPMIQSAFLFTGLIAIYSCITVPTAIKAAFEGNFEAKVLNIGLGLLILSGLYDLLTILDVLPLWHTTFPWGVFAFIVGLGYIIEYRFAEAHRQLEEYSLTLEQKVEERTQELREAQSQMVMQAKMASLGDLVAGVAHEMNNPVGVIGSAADTANRGINRIRDLLQKLSTRLHLMNLNHQELDEVNHEEGQLQKSLKLLETNHQVISTASDRVANIVQSLRSFAGLDEAIFQQVDLHNNIDITLTLIQHELRDKITVIKEYGEITRIQCYPNELNQAFMNLLRNAVQAIEQQGTITITTYSDQEKVYIKISDTGKGIAPEDLPKIYDPGFTTQSGGIGKGLGLSIVYNIIQKHHGSIEVNSEAGKGTEVVIILLTEQTL